ncbi:MAG: hypothetical protein MJD61_02365 [Proteobacteria bacterium]|nr:hypothetical protein [Pseudomonadota bacterium]
MQPSRDDLASSGRGALWAASDADPASESRVRKTIAHTGQCRMLQRVNVCTGHAGAVAGLLVGMLGLGASPAHAEPPAARIVEAAAERMHPSRTSGPEPALGSFGRLLAGGALFVPGLALHGAGSYSLGDRDTALRLLALEGIGLAAGATGLLGIWLTGASPKTVAPLAWLAIDGTGTFLLSWLADVYHVLRPEVTGRPAIRLAWLEAGVGLGHVRDLVLSHRGFASLEVTLRVGRLRFGLQALGALNVASRGVRSEVGYRFVGATPRTSQLQVSFVDLAAGARYHRYTEDGFDQLTLDLEFTWRLDMTDLAQPLQGSFTELSWGLGWASYGGHHAIRRDNTQLLLARIGYGVWLGCYQARWLELMLYYDHRRDGLVGGQHLPRGGGGAAFGLVGLRATTWLDANWGAQVDLVRGSATMLMGKLLFRHGDLQ